MLNKVYCTIIASIFCLSGIAQCLSGSYSIGGTNADYPTFNSAVNALIANGICAPVVFQVRDSTYHEQFSIPAIAGASATNTITFEAAYGSVGQVFLELPSTILANNYLVELNGASHIYFKHINFRRSGTGAYCAMVYITNAAHNLYFTNSTFTGTAASSFNFNQLLVYANSNSTYKNVAFKNCSFNKGSMGFYINYNADSINYNIAVDSSNFSDHYSGGITIQRTQGIKVSHCNFTANNSVINSYYYALLVNECYDSLRITGNRFVSNQESAGFLSVNNTSGGSQPILIDNNFVTGGKKEAVMLADCSNAIVAYNSVNRQPTNPGFPSGWAVHTSNGSNIRILNNCFYGKHFIWVEGTTNIVCDYNNYWSTAIFQNGGQTYNFATWKTATGYDSHSVVSLPNYFGYTNLHILSNPALNGHGTPISQITNDIDNEPRDLQFPDIGADEFVPAFNNLQALSFSSGFPICTGLQDVRLTVQNYGGNTIDSFKVNWKVNGQAQPTYTWHGNLAPEDSLTTTIGTYNYMPDSIYTIVINTLLPNNQNDPEPANDTLRANAGKTRMSGVYTVGGTYPYFATIADAALALALRGVCGPVTLNLRNGIYYESAEFINIDGTSAINTITLQSESGDSSAVTWLGYGNYTLKLTGTSYFTVRQITLTNINPIANNNLVPPIPVIVIGSGSNYVCIENNLVTGKRICQGVSADCALINITNALTPNTGLLIRRNHFKGGSVGVFIDQTTSQYCKGWRIEYNQFTNPLSSAIYAKKLDSCFIANNTIIQKDTMTYFFNDYAAINVTGIKRTSIYNNQVSCSNLAGISIEDGAIANNTYNRIINNFITTRYFGIRYYATNGVLCYYNSINVVDSNAKSHVFDTDGSGPDNSNVRVFNNILANTAGGKIFNGTPEIIANHNCYYTTGAISTSYATLAQWQQTGNDTNSVILNPQFLSPTNLHILSNPLLQGIADTTLLVSRDIDGDLRRNSTAYPGADEIAGSQLDIKVALTAPTGATCHALPYIKVNIINLSATDTLHYIALYTYVNGAPVDTNYWTGALAPADTVTNFSAGSFLFTYGIGHTIKVIARLPNYGTDINTSNDTATLPNLDWAMGGTYTIGGNNPDFTTPGAALKAIGTMGLCAPVVFRIRAGYYNEPLLHSYPIPGSSGINNITFISDEEDTASVVLDYRAHDFIYAPSNTLVMSLSNVEHIVFEKLSIRHIASADDYTSSIAFTGCNNISFTHCMIRGQVLSNNCRNMRFSNNIVEYGGINLRTATAIPATSAIVNNNVFRNTAYYMNNTVAAIIFFRQSNFTVAGNCVMGINGASNLIYLDSCSGGIIENNKANLQHSIWPNAGIYIYKCLSAPNPIIVRNNFIYLGADLAGTTQVGLICDASSNIRILHNTIWGRVAASVNPTYVVSFSGSYNLHLYNNIINVPGARQLFGNSTITSDYNLFGDSLMQPGIRLAAWRTSTGNDLHSEVGNILMQLENSGLSIQSDTDVLPGQFTYPLHYDSAANRVYHTWNVLSDVTTDIDTDTRGPMLVCYGADEYNEQPRITNARLQLLAPLADTVCIDSFAITVRVTNNGNAPLHYFKLNWSINGIQKDPYYYSGNMANTQSVILSLGQHYFADTGAYTLKAWIIHPSIIVDTITTNDTVYKQYYVSAVQQVQISANGNLLTADGGYTEYQWYLNGSVINGATSATHFATVPGTYVVTTVDANGCPGISQPFTILSSNSLTADNFILYPNPTTGILYIKTDNQEMQGLVIYNTSGQQVVKKESAVNNLDISDLPAGVYTVEVITVNTNYKLRLIKL